MLNTGCLLLAMIGLVRGIEHYKWMYFKPYGSTVHLEPLFNDTQCLPRSQCFWLLPDKQTRLTYPLASGSSSKYALSSNGTLTIVDIQSSDNGIYHFFRMNQSQWIVSKSLLNLRGAPFASRWLEYWPNVVGGLVAMAVVLITFGLITLADKYRYRAPRRAADRRPGIVESLNESVRVTRMNPVFLDDEHEIAVDSKRSLSRRSSSNSNATHLRVEQF